MGNGTSKEEQLYHAVLNSNHNAVKALHRDGASLEFVDKEGRTPLILACTRGDLFEMALMLLNLGANIKAYRPGTYGGYPLHHAAKRGLDKTALLLLSRGADPLAVNDDSLTPLHMARNRGHVAVIRMIEGRTPQTQTVVCAPRQLWHLQAAVELLRMCTISNLTHSGVSDRIAFVYSAEY